LESRAAKELEIKKARRQNVEKRKGDLKVDKGELQKGLGVQRVFAKAVSARKCVVDE
jgi:hypothetical protein